MKTKTNHSAIYYSSMSDQDLMEELKQLIGTENKMLARSLAYISEVRRRRLFLREGYPTIYEFCLKVLPLSPGSVYRRTQVARHVQRHPLLLDLIAQGKLTLTAASKIVPCLQAGNQDEWLRSFVGLTGREIEERLAGQPNCSESPDLVTRVKDKVIPLFEMPQTNPASTSSTATPRLETHGKERPSTEQVQPSEKPATMGDHSCKRERRYSFRFTGSEHLKNKIQRAKEVLSHKHPEGKLEEVLNAALDQLLEAHAPELQKTKKSSRPSNVDSPYIPKKMRREAFAKANYSCEQRATSGRRCGSRHQLEVDHVIPRAHGGKTVPENLQILCKAHNLDKAKNQMGEALIESKILARRRNGILSQRNFAQG